MKWRFAWFYRAALAALFAAAVWTIWGEVQSEAGPAVPNPITGRFKLLTQAADKVLTDTNAAKTNGASRTEPGTNSIWAKFDFSFGLDKVDSLNNVTMLGQPLWKYLAFLIYIILAFYTAKVMDWLVNSWLKRVTSKKERETDELILELLHGPVKMVAFVIFLNIGLSLFEWPDHAQLMLSRGLIVLAACSLTYLALNLIDLALRLWQEKIVSTQDRVFATQLVPLVSKVSKTALLIAAALLTADNLDIRITSAIAGLSVGGLALGLAAQDTVANLFGAVAIFLDKPFYVGDVIRVEGVEGAVDSIGLRSTRVRNTDGYHVTIPNKLMGNAIIINITRRPTIKSQINLGLSFDTPAEKVARAVALLEEIFRGDPRTADLIISFNKFGESALNILVVHEWSGAGAREHFAAMQALNLQIKDRLDREGIQFALPNRTLVLPGPGQQLGSPAAPHPS